MGRSEATAVNSNTKPTFILIDGHSLAFRSYFAFAKGRDGGLKTSTGVPTSVCFGFLKSLVEVISSQKPEYMAVAFDLSDPTFRHEADATYKEGRPETPEDFKQDMVNLRELLAALNLAVVTSPGFEADDILATLGKAGSDAGYQVKIVSGDRDLFQLVDAESNLSVLYLGQTFWKRSGGTGPVEFGPEEVKEKLGVSPEQVVDFKALCGDKSDNIPGVKGIGEKGAIALLTEYGNLDAIYANLDQIKGANQKKLEAGKADAYHSQMMAQLRFDAPVEVGIEDCKLQGFQEAKLEELLTQLEFKTYLKKIKELQAIFGGKREEVTDSKPWEIEDESLSFFSLEETKAAQQAQQNTDESQLGVQIIDTPEKLDKLVEQLQQCTDKNLPTAWDTETTDLDPQKAELVGIGCCFQLPNSEKPQVCYLPIGHHSGQNLERAIALEQLRPILESNAYPKVLQNAKFDRLILHYQGIKLQGVVFETLLASYILNPDSSHSLSDLAIKYLGLISQSYDQLVPKGKTIADIDIPAVANYCGMDAYVTFSLVPHLRQALAETPQLLELLYQIEIPLEPVLAEMEIAGISIDTAYLKTLSQQLEQQLAEIEKSAYKAAGGEFNLGSPKQVSEILFNKLGLPTKKSRKIKTGYSTDAATLERLQEDDESGVVEAIIDYRTLDKLKSTYVDALPLLVSPKTQRIHTNFNQSVTATGRLSSSNPNLQNIPIRTEFSRQIRKAFLPKPGWVLVAADYSQIELRILAHLSQEPILVEAYQKNLDIHSVTAQLLFEREDITSEERRLAKTINFGVIYGMGALRFSRSAKVDKTNANTFIQRFNDRYPKVFEYLQGVKKQAIALGYAETILGRRRYFNFETESLKSLKGKNPEEINLGELKRLSANDAGNLRAAANAPIQGSSADIIKIAMVKLHQILQNYQAKLLLQVHDELVLEMPPAEWEELQPQIKQTMENALFETNVKFSVPLIVEIHKGDNWMDAK